MKPKVIQLGGRKTGAILMKAEPFPRKNCERKDCQLCWQAVQEGREGSLGVCYRGSCAYQGHCNRCPRQDTEAGIPEEKARQALYIGESDKSAYRRIQQHEAEYRRKAARNWMWDHTKEVHGGIIGGEGKEGKEDYTFAVKGSFHNATTRIADECVRIRREEEGKHEALGGEGPVEILNTKFEFHPARDVRVTFVQF